MPFGVGARYEPREVFHDDQGFPLAVPVVSELTGQPESGNIAAIAGHTIQPPTQQQLTGYASLPILSTPLKGVRTGQGTLDWVRRRGTFQQAEKGPQIVRESRQGQRLRQARLCLP